MRTRPLQPLTVLALFAGFAAARMLAQTAAAPTPPPPPVTPAAGEPAPAVAVTPAAAEPAAATTVANKPAADAAPVPAPAGAATKSKDAVGRDTLSVDFPDTDVREILRNVADLFELNIIMPESLQGKTTIKLREVTWRQIFENVLKPLNYTYVEDGNIIKIVSNESLLQEPTSTEVFLVNYARAQDILPVITSLVDAAAGGKIVVDSRSNSLVITERPSRMNRIRPIIETLDRATDQVLIESKFVEVTDRDVKNIGVNWSSLANYNVSIGNIKGTFDRTRGQTASNGADATNASTRATTNTNTNNSGTNTSATQDNGATNAGTVTAANGSPTATSTTGTTGALTNNVSTTGSNTIAGAITDTANNALNQLMNIANTGSTNRSATAVFNADEFRLVLSALQTQNDVKIVSNPTIVTLNNSEATINVGEEDPIPNYTYNQERGSFEVSGFTWKQIGILLKVTPQVNSRGSIKLTLAPEVSQKNGSTTFGGAGGASLPIVATRKAVTTVSIQDGYTMGIGGLLTTQSTKGQNKVPVLGSVPLLGRLFRSDSKEESVTNLIIFVTAKTISANGAPVEQVFDSERVRQLQLRREDLPGHRDGSNPFISGEPQPRPSRTK